MVPVSVLLVEDNEDILANLYAYLEPLGYELDCARNGRTGLEMAASGQFDLVVLDIMLPGLDGISLCRALREEHGVQVPVIMLTARDTVADRVLGLDAGADDYLVKPFALRELEARIRALLRRGRTQESAQGGELRVDDVCIDVAGHRASASCASWRAVRPPWSVARNWSAASGATICPAAAPCGRISTNCASIWTSLSAAPCCTPSPMWATVSAVKRSPGRERRFPHPAASAGLVHAAGRRSRPDHGHGGPALL